MMRTMMTIQLLVPAVWLLMGNAADAQEKGRTGLTMGYPASVGLVWHPSDAFALRPELSLSTVSSDSSMTGVRDGSSVGVGLSALFYVGRWDSLRAYVSPRFTFNRVRIDSFNDAGPTKTYGWSGSFGTQYALHRKFSVFGEVGVGHSHAVERFASTVFGSSMVSQSTIDSWSTRTGVGVLFYF